MHLNERIASTGWHRSKRGRAAHGTRHREAGEVELVSVILEACNWQKRPFAKYQAIKPGGKTVRQRKPYRAAFNDMEEDLRRLIEACLTGD